jgi:hypothetical protein
MILSVSVVQKSILSSIFKIGVVILDLGLDKNYLNDVVVDF